MSLRGSPHTISALGALFCSALLASCGSVTIGATFDPGVDELEEAIEAQVGVPVTVTCPTDIPVEQGKITDCTVSDGQDAKILRLTQDDAEGHYTWEVTPQDAG